LRKDTVSVAAAAGTGASGTSIQGQAAAAVVTTLREARAPGDDQPCHKSCDVSAEEFERRNALVQDGWCGSNLAAQAMGKVRGMSSGPW
jgi:hypothetical protein